MIGLCKKTLGLCLLIMVGSLVPGILGHLSLNLGFIKLTRVEIESTAHDNTFLDTQSWLQQAGHYPGVRQEAFRGLGLLWARNEMTGQAQMVLEQARDMNPENPLVHLALGDLYDREGNTRRAITEFAAIGYRSREYEAAVNYLDLLDQVAYTGSNRNDLLLQVLALDRGNIVAAYVLAAQPNETKGVHKPELVWQLQHFPISQIYRSGQPGRRMAAHLARMMPELVDRDLWDLALALRIIDWWIRVGYYDAAEIALTGLLEKHPATLSVRELLARTYYESDEWGKAITIAESILTGDPNSVVARRYLAVSYDARGDSAMAGIWRRRYRELAPDDWWGADLSSQRYESEIVKAVGNLLDELPTDVVLGGNELPDIDLAAPARWQFAVWTPGGAYSARSELDGNIGVGLGLNGQAAAAVCGLWREDAYAGIKLQEPVQIESGTNYVLSFLYRVDGNQRYQFTVRSAGPFSERYWLPSTAGEWRLFVAIGASSTVQGADMVLQLINGGLGCLDVTRIELRKVRTPGPVLDDGVQLFTVRGRGNE